MRYLWGGGVRSKIVFVFVSYGSVLRKTVLPGYFEVWGSGLRIDGAKGLGV